jgi:hypothetical protein
MLINKHSYQEFTPGKALSPDLAQAVYLLAITFAANTGAMMSAPRLAAVAAC